MRATIIAGNWKMNNTLTEARSLLTNIIHHLQNQDSETKVIFAVPFTYIKEAVDLTKRNSHIFISAQNCHWAERGAFTGEISTEMIKSCGAEYVIVGHSERRQIFHEDDEIIAQKIIRVFHSNLSPIFCCGEQLADRKNKNHFNVVERQLQKGLFHLDKKMFTKTVIAYEPVWAIGTGESANPDQAQEMHLFIRNLVAKSYDTVTADKISILYGGSLKPENASSLLSQPDIDGGLIGGASLKADDFAGIVNLTHYGLS